jgi:hypothetical protein
VTGEIPTELFGAWRLVSYEDRESEGEAWDQPLGGGAHGLFLCHPPATVSVQIYAPQPPVADGPLYVGYFGRAVARNLVRDGGSTRGELLLSLDGGHPAGALDADEPRPFEITGDTLILGDQRTWRRTLLRAT